MTTQEIDEAKKLIAAMRDDVSIIATSSPDAERLATLVLEKIPHTVDSYEQLARLLRPREISPEFLWSIQWESVDQLADGLVTIKTSAEVTKKGVPEFEAKLVYSVAQKAPRILSALFKIELYLATQAPESTAH